MLPRFKVALDARPALLSAGPGHQGTSAGHYVFGKPVDRRHCNVAIEATDIGARDCFDKLDLRTDARGVAAFEVTPCPHARRPRAGRRSRSGRRHGDGARPGRPDPGRNRELESWPPQSIRIEVIPEAGELVKDLPNTIHLLTTTLDGRPARTRSMVSGLDHESLTSGLGLPRSKSPRRPMR